MEHETQQPMDEQPEAAEISAHTATNGDAVYTGLIPSGPDADQGVARFFFGPDGLRAGWSVAIWLVLMALLLAGIGSAFVRMGLIVRKLGTTPKNMFFNELGSVLALVVSVALMALIERRRILDYNLRGTHRPRHFVAGLAVGFVGLSALIGGLAAGGWLHFGGAALSGPSIVAYGLVWGATFLLVGLFEEGAFRCYLQATLTRGLNFWVALGIVAAICAWLAATHEGNGVRGDYGLALLGLLPCLGLHVRRTNGRGFWYAAWVTSTLFGMVHTANGGENWIGIFAAGAIGFVFCVSIRLTGSAWWAIGAHAGWDWGETYFYGTPDSGMVAPGHYLSSTLSGNTLWSGGQAGPEGSLLVIAVILLMLVWLLVVYGRRGHEAVQVASPVADAALQ